MMADCLISSWQCNKDNGGFATEVITDDALESVLSTIGEQLVMKKTSSNQNFGEGKSRHQSLPISEWNRIREPFTKLWYEDGLELKDVAKLMAEQYDFHASLSMYKKQSADWGLSKIITTEEKIAFGILAEELIAKKKELPTHDLTGRTIPWHRVRRKYGRDKIPLQYLPPQFRKKVLTRDGKSSVSRLRTNSEQPQDKIDFAVRNHHTESRVLQLSKHEKGICFPRLTDTTSIFHISPDMERTEKLLLHINEWYMWCQLNDISRSITAPVEIWGQCEKAWTYLKRHDRRAYSTLASLASNIRDAFEQPTVFLPGCILGIWAALQDKDFGEHGLSIARFLVSCSKSVLSPSNPLSSICYILLEDALANISRNVRNRVSLPMNVIASYIEDELNTHAKGGTSQGLKTGSSLLYALTWHDASSFGWATSPEDRLVTTGFLRIYDTLLGILSEQDEGSTKVNEIKRCLFEFSVPGCGKSQAAKRVTDSGLTSYWVDTPGFTDNDEYQIRFPTHSCKNEELEIVVQILESVPDFSISDALNTRMSNCMKVPTYVAYTYDPLNNDSNSTISHTRSRHRRERSESFDTRLPG